MIHSHGHTGRLTAVLGPTNTGKTHLAVERMLGHRTGMIGCPLRLLAREIYDRVAAARGVGQVALITGEEKIVPQRPLYFVCTTESMPSDRAVEFVAIDEVQLAADPERGHVFTDRLLRARGLAETMFLGSQTMAALVRRLVADVEFVSRPRLSKLSFAGARKITRLPLRSAVVAFSAAEVYQLAELLRRFRGGAAVVMGALSPRTRNAQVALYQSGEVDYLVATDAIGMGLNMNVDHVAFAGLSKFDGRELRDLTAAEIAQIAGRAGRHARDGTFGTTLDAGEIDPDFVAAVEDHSFPPVRRIYWRNPALDFTSVEALIRGLEMPPPDAALMRPREAEDAASLRSLAQVPDVSAAAKGHDAVSLLWEVCRIPDFRNSVSDAHVGLLSAVYRHLVGPGVLPAAWVVRQVERLDHTDGDIDTLATRIAHIRTWNYIAHRPGWVESGAGLQDRAREIEDKLSDALHERLTQRFVDRRTTILARRLKQNETPVAAVRKTGEVLVEGEHVGTLTGFDFLPDDLEEWRNGRAIRAAVRRALAPEIRDRAASLLKATAEALSMDDFGTVYWKTAPVARLVRGDRVLAPAARLIAAELVPDAMRRQLELRLTRWIHHRLAEVLAPLHRTREAALSGAGRGLVYQLVEALGSISRQAVAQQVRALLPADKRELARVGVRLGRETVFVAAMLKPRQVAMRALLWCLHEDIPIIVADAGRASFAIDDTLPEAYCAAIGYRRLGPRALRVDMAERLASELRKRSQSEPFPVVPSLLKLAGCASEDFGGVARALGYRSTRREDGGTLLHAPPRRRRRARVRRQSHREPRADSRAASPFAALNALKGNPT